MAARFALLAPFALASALAAACSSASADSDAASGSGGMTATGGVASSGSGGMTATGGATSSGSGGMIATGGVANSSAGASEAGASTGGAPTSDDAGAGGMPGTAPYANVTAVVTSGNDGAYTFNVSVESADIDCTQFADWWEVLSEDGALLYRRILEHSHTDENGTSDADAPGNTFTRSGGPVPVATDDIVIVRAHMSVGGYNGRVMRGSASTSFADAPDIGSDFAADVEDDDPQPTGCEF